MKRKTAAVTLILLSIPLLFSCTYNVMDKPDSKEPPVVITPDDGSYAKAELDMVTIEGLEPDAGIKASDMLLSFPDYFTRFFEDGFMSEVCRQIGLELPELSYRPTKAISSIFEFNAENEVLSMGTPYKNWSEVYLDRLSLKASGNTSNLAGLILHHIDPMEWPVNVPVSGTIEFNIKSGIRNGSDKPDEPMPKAYAAARLAIQMNDMVFKTIQVNGVTIPVPVKGRMNIAAFDVSFASSHATYEDTPDTEFPSLGENKTYTTEYAPFCIELHVDPTLEFNVADLVYAIDNIVKSNENAAPYWSYIVNCCWDEFAGDHITLSVVTGNGNNNIMDSLKLSDLNLFQAIIFGI